MMHNYKIRINIKTVAGFEPLSEFFLGKSSELANSIFAALEGNTEIDEAIDILQIDLVEIRNGLPTDVKIKHCTLTQLGKNCCFIAKELFKYKNFISGD